MNQETIAIDSLVFLSASLEGSREKFAEEMPAPDAELYEHQMHEAKVWQDAVKDMIRARGEIGRQIIAALWHVYYNDMHTLLGEYNTLTDWVRDQLNELDEDAEDADVDRPSRGTILDYAMIVERIFPIVFQRQNSKNPFTVDGQTVTIDTLINTAGLISKLKMLSSHFVEADASMQDAIVKTVMTESRSGVASLRDSLSTKKSSIKIPYTKTHREDGTWEIVMHLTDEQRTFLEAQLKNIGEEITA